MRSVKTHLREWGDVAATGVFSSADQSRLATCGTSGLCLVLSASSSLWLPRRMHFVVPFNVFGHRVGSHRLGQLTNGALMSSFIVSRAASWHIDTTSAPEHPSVCMDMSRGSNVYNMETHQKRNFRNVDRRVNAHLR